MRFKDFEDIDVSEYVEKLDELSSISEDIIGSQTHTIFSAENFPSKSENVLIPPFQEICEESYLDAFDDI